MTAHMPAYLNYLWAESVPPGSPYSGFADEALALWTDNPKTGTPLPRPKHALHAKDALTALAGWRPQAVVADARARSPLGRYLASVLGHPTVRVGGLIGWRISARR
jgi:hypothetical protein